MLKYVHTDAQTSTHFFYATNQHNDENFTWVRADICLCEELIVATLMQEMALAKCKIPNSFRNALTSYPVLNELLILPLKS